MRYTPVSFAKWSLVLAVTSSAFSQDCVTTVWVEDVEGYVSGENIITGQPCFPCPPGFSWQAWDDEFTHGQSVADDAFGNPGLSINVDGTRADRLVHTYNDLGITSGTWLFSADLYVPSCASGVSHFRLLNEYVSDGSKNWSTRVRIDTDSERLESAFDGGVVDLQFGAWRRLEVLISLDDDLQTIRYDGAVVNLPGKTWTRGSNRSGLLDLTPPSSGGTLEIEALELFGGDAAAVYWDNLTLCSIPPHGACCFRSDPCVDGINRADCESLQGDAVFQGIGSACGSCPFYGSDGWEVDDLLTTAPPFQWEGDTCNDYPGAPFNPDCEFFPSDCSECGLSSSQDQAWVIDIPWDGMWTFSTCGAADFDTVLYAGAATCTSTFTNDNCTRIPGEDDSELAIALTRGDTIAVTLEGFAEPDCGVYTLSVGAPCPPLAIGPDQEVLGPCTNGDDDPENIGCNAAPGDPPTFTDIVCGDVFAGTVGNYIFDGELRRDFDWFKLDVPTARTITLDVVGNYPQVVVLLADLNANPGMSQDECTDAGNILASYTTPTCVDQAGVRASARISVPVGPGLYAPIVSTAFSDIDVPIELGGVPCGSPYEMTVTCEDTCPRCGGTGGVNFALTGAIIGAPNGDCWNWQIIPRTTGDFASTEVVTTRGITPNDDDDDLNNDDVWDEEDIALRFADSINQYALDHGCDINPGTYELRADVVETPPGTFNLSVTAQCELDLLVNGCNVRLTPPCPFNPTIEYVPLPGMDCNANGFDDVIDIRLGTSEDSNQNDVPDECECDPESGDVTGDGCVTFSDILTILGAWGNTGEPGIPGDANCDGLVSFLDVLVVLSTWGQGEGCP